VLIDRGYLGVEIDVEQVATEQKRMIEIAHGTGKPVIVANQILETSKKNKSIRNGPSNLTLL
jgi:pyruvate kinase